MKNLKKLSKLLSVVAMAFVIGTFFVNSALAATTTNNTNDRPGFGFGDHHHHHTGPPGRSDRPGDRDGDEGHEFFNFFSFFYNFFRTHNFG